MKVFLKLSDQDPAIAVLNIEDLKKGLAIVRIPPSEKAQHLVVELEEDEV